MNKQGILVVEDQKIIALEIKERLTEMGYKVIGSAKSGKQAIQLATDLVPDLILMDIKLEGSMDGIEAAAEIKEIVDCPIVFLTAYADDKTIQRAKITEPYGYIVKPLDERELRSAIEIALYKSIMQKKLKDSEAKYRSIVSTLEGLLYVVDSEYNLIINNITPEGLNKASDKKCYEFIYDLEKPCVNCPMDKLLQGITTRMEVFDKKRNRQFYSVSTPVKLIEGMGYFQHYLIDITERKKNENDIILMLHEKETLIREIHHRVKNNLQLMLSLIRLQISKSDNGTVVSSLREFENRLNSIAIIHEDLYSALDLARIPFNSYIKKLINQFIRANGVDTHKISINHEIENLLMSVDYIIPIGIIINELITNALKHAFAENSAGKINVKFGLVESNYVLDVLDNGVGIPENESIDEPKRLGFQIINSLCKQMNGKFEVNINNGTHFKFIIPKIESKQKLN